MATKTVEAVAREKRAARWSEGEGLPTGSGGGGWAQYRLPFLSIMPAFLVLALVTFYTNFG